MGVATLLVIVVHLWGADDAPQWIQNIQQFAQNGVDIFLFISGLGCYYSYTNNGTIKFYKHRAIRILPPYIIVLTAYILVQVLSWKYTFWESYSTNSIAAFFIQGIVSGWFVSAIVVLYLITPLLCELLNKKPTAYWLVFAGVLIFLSQVSYYYISDTFYNIKELFLNRIPIYMVGIFFGKYIKDNEEKELMVTKTGFIILSISIFILFFINSFFNKTFRMDFCHYISILLSPICVIWMTFLFNKYPCPALQEIGNISFESYLLNEKIGLLIYVYIATADNYSINLIAFTLTIIFGYILRKVCSSVFKNKK